MTAAEKMGNPLFDAWMDASRRLLGNAEPLSSGPMVGEPQMTDAMTQADEAWQLCQRQVSDWFKASQHWFAPHDAKAPAEGVAEETFRRMLDPSRFLFAGTDEINQAIQRLVEGPELADIGTIERQLLKATREWLSLREASAAHRAVISEAWGRAFQTFSKEMLSNPALFRQGARSVLDRWLAIANDELIRTQRTEGFLKTQRDLLATGVAYRLKERDLVEVWCETHSIPTRTEVDDLHRTVHDLKSQIRKLKAQLSGSNASSEQSGSASPKAAGIAATPVKPKGDTAGKVGRRTS